MLDVDDENPHPGPSDGNPSPVVPAPIVPNSPVPAPPLDRPPSAGGVPVPPSDGPMTVERRLIIPVDAPVESPVGGEIEVPIDGVGIAPLDPADQTDYFIRVRLSGPLPTLETNLPRTTAVQTTEQGCAWLLGRSRNCAIVFPDPAISRCHAVLSYEAARGFYLMDTASSNGTRLNGQRLVVMQAQRVQTGDLIILSHIAIRFWVE
jgi:hypothetical protein